MAVYKRTSGIWYVQFYHNGKTHIRTSGSTNKKVAMDLEVQMRSELLADDEAHAKNEIGFHEAIDKYLLTQRTSTSHKNYLAIAKWTKYHTHNTLLSTWHNLKFEKLLEKKAEEEVSNGTLYQYVNFYKQVLKYCKKRNLRVNHVEFPSYKIDNNRLRYLTNTEEKLLITTLIERCLFNEHDLVIMLLDTGARLNEILSLQSKHIDLDNRAISLYRSKVDNESILMMTNRIYDVLKNRTELFANMQLTTLRVVLKELFEDVTIHTLRHTLASKLIQNDVALVEVKEILGHKDWKTTLKYAHLDSVKTSKKVATLLNTIQV
jgi:integrase